MNNQKLIIYEFDELYRILIEINNDVNLIIKKAFKNDISYFISQPNTLILTQKKIAGLDNQIIFNDFQLCLLSAILISIWPFVPTGGLFNNWLNIIYFFPVGFFLSTMYPDKNN